MTDPYLVNPQFGTKKCLSCQRIKFTVDFAQCDLFADDYLPVCRPCFKTPAGKACVASFNFKVLCKKCKFEKPLEAFSARRLPDSYNPNEKVTPGKPKYTSGNPFGLSPTCLDCNRARFVN